MTLHAQGVRTRVLSTITIIDNLVQRGCKFSCGIAKCNKVREHRTKCQRADPFRAVPLESFCQTLESCTVFPLVGIFNAWLRAELHKESLSRGKLMCTVLCRALVKIG